MFGLSVHEVSITMMQCPRKEVRTRTPSQVLNRSSNHFCLSLIPGSIERVHENSQRRDGDLREVQDSDQLNIDDGPTFIMSKVRSVSLAGLSMSV